MITNSPGSDWSEDAFDIFDLALGVIVIAAFLVLAVAFWLAS